MPHSPSHEVIMKTQSLSFLLTLFLSSLAFGQDVSQSETSYSGAKILEGDIDVFFNESVPIGNPDAELEPYAFFEGNTLYAGNSDKFGNTVDAIIEFFLSLLKKCRCWPPSFFTTFTAISPLL